MPARLSRGPLGAMAAPRVYRSFRGAPRCLAREMLRINNSNSDPSMRRPRPYTMPHTPQTGTPPSVDPRARLPDRTPLPLVSCPPRGLPLLHYQNSNSPWLPRRSPMRPALLRGMLSRMRLRSLPHPLGNPQTYHCVRRVQHQSSTSRWCLPPRGFCRQRA